MLDSFDLYTYTNDWKSENNTLGTDFNLYSTLEDAIQDTNAWTYCNYDDPNVGMFRDCGPTGPVASQWTHRTWAWQPASFYLQTVYGSSLGDVLFFGDSRNVSNSDLTCLRMASVGN